MDVSCWGHVVDPELEATEIHFHKCILNLPPSATNMAVCGELGQLYTPSSPVERKDIELATGIDSAQRRLQRGFSPIHLDAPNHLCFPCI